MRRSIQLKIATSALTNCICRATRQCLFPLVLLTCLASASSVQAVTPAPDGGYPGSNTAEGTQALFSRTTGIWDTALGFQALYSDTTGNSNTATGLRALFSNKTGNKNTATGVYALYSNTTASFNTAIGWNALTSNTTGSNNTATGFQALANNTADGNVAVGSQALIGNTTGTLNTAVGDSTGQNVITGDNNTYIGDFVGSQAADESNTIRIGDLSNGNGSGSLACFIGGIFNNFQPVGGSVVQVTLDLANDELGWDTAASSARFKDEIKPMDKASEAILALKPVTFRYKKEIDRKGIPRFGLVAEDVEKVNPDLVTRDRDGKLFTVRYDAVNAMLLNEFLKEHRKVEEQEATIRELKKDFRSKFAEQQKQIKALTAGLQKVSAQVEASKPAPRTALNNQ
jgi:hypothetical protein